MVKKTAFTVSAAVLVLWWIFFGVLIPGGMSIVAFPHGRFVSGSEEFFMADGLRGGTLVVRSYWHYADRDGVEREYGTIWYGWGKGHKDVDIEVVKEKGRDSRIINVLIQDEHLTNGSLWRSPDDPTVDADLLKEALKSIEMGRKRLADWRQKSLPRT